MSTNEVEGKLLASVIICTRNRAASLARTLQSLVTASAQVVDAWELLVVDNGSTDDTATVIASFAGALPIRAVNQPVPGLSNARNAGVSASLGAYVLWTDDDVLVDESWLSCWFDAFRSHPDQIVFGGRSIPVYEEPVQDWFKNNQHELRYLLAIRDDTKQEWIEPHYLPFGLNYAIRGPEQRAHLYDPDLGVAPGRRKGGEEEAVIRQLLAEGAQGRWVWDAIVYHLISPERQTEAYIRHFFVSAGFYNPLKAQGRVKGKLGLILALTTYARAKRSYEKERRRDRTASVAPLIALSRAEGSLRHHLRLKLN